MIEKYLMLKKHVSGLEAFVESATPFVSEHFFMKQIRLSLALHLRSLIPTSFQQMHIKAKTCLRDLFRLPRSQALK